MSRFTPAQLAETALLLAVGIKNLRLDNFMQANEQLFGPELMGPTISVGAVATDFTPGYFAISDSREMYLVLDGTLTWTQAYNQMASFIGGPLDSLLSPVSQYYIDAATSILTAMKQGGIGWPQQIWAGGWSLGGATLSLMPSLSRLDPPGWRASNLHTFGAPRPSSNAVAHTINGSTDLTRWMNDNDPVPLVPPRIQDFPGLIVAFGVRGAMRAQSFCHPAGGLELSAAGGMQSLLLPSLAEANFTASLIQWLYELDIGASAGHYITTYMERLTTAAKVALAKGQLHLARTESADRFGRRAVAAAERQYANSVTALERRQNERPVLIPAARLFHAVWRSGTWFVEYGSQVIAACGTRRAARRLARRANELLADMQARAAVDPQAFLQSLSSYLDIATDPAGGFQPVMNTTFPQ